jgi:hypothetical protein
LTANLTPPKDLPAGFAGAILTGGLLPTPPLGSPSDEPPDFLAARFTVKSAVCVTGLVAADTGRYYSSLDEIIILALNQVGELGLSCMATTTEGGVPKVTGNQRKVGVERGRHARKVTAPALPRKLRVLYYLDVSLIPNRAFLMRA